VSRAWRNGVPPRADCSSVSHGFEQYPGNLVGVKVDLVLKVVLRPAISQHILKELVPVSNFPGLPGNNR
jgi:hypothetical protein